MSLQNAPELASGFFTMKSNSSRSARRETNGFVSNEHLVDGKYSIKDLVDINRLRTSFEEFSKATGFTTGFVSYPDQEILISTGWRDACTKYHRHCPASGEACRESNIYLTAHLKNLKELSIKQCSNGLVDGATPVIIRGRHLASVSTGQVLLGPPDLAYFKKQAKKYGYDEKAYLAAIKQVPVVNEHQFKQVLRYLSSLAVLVAEEGLNALHFSESEKKYRDLFENSRDAILTAEPSSGRFTSGNPAALKIFGAKSEEEFLTHSPMDLSPERQPDGRVSAEKAREMIEKAMREGFHFFEWTHRRINGEEFFADVLLSWIERNGNPVVLATVRDITERKWAEEAMAESEAQFRAMFEVASIGVAQADPHTGQWLRVNQKMCTITGYTADELLQVRFVDLTHPEDRKKDWEEFQRVARGEVPDYRLEKRYVRKDGSLVWVNVNVTVIRDSAGRPVRTMAAIEDITERKRTEEALETEITERQRLEREILEISEQEKARVGQDLHDGLCQTLAGIGCLARVLQRNLDEEKLSPDAVSAKAESIVNLLKKATNEARGLATGMYPVNIEEYGLAPGLKKLADETAQRFHIACKFECAEPIVLADNDVAKHIYRITQEAVSNAIRHGKTESVVITLAAINNRVTLKIEDNGQGVLTEFKPTGMGLKTMNYRAHAIGGSLEIRQRPENGIEVICSFPNQQGPEARTRNNP